MSGVDEIYFKGNKPVDQDIHIRDRAGERDLHVRRGPEGAVEVTAQGTQGSYNAPLASPPAGVPLGAERYLPEGAPPTFPVAPGFGAPRDQAWQPHSQGHQPHQQPAHLQSHQQQPQQRGVSYTQQAQQSYQSSKAAAGDVMQKMNKDQIILHHGKDALATHMVALAAMGVFLVLLPSVARYFVTRPTMYAGATLLCDDTEALRGWGAALGFAALLTHFLRTSNEVTVISRGLKNLAIFWGVMAVFKVFSAVSSGSSIVGSGLTILFDVAMAAAAVSPFYGHSSGGQQQQGHYDKNHHSD